MHRINFSTGSIMIFALLSLSLIIDCGIFLFLYLIPNLLNSITYWFTASLHMIGLLDITNRCILLTDICHRHSQPRILRHVQNV